MSKISGPGWVVIKKAYDESHPDPPDWSGCGKWLLVAVVVFLLLLAISTCDSVNPPRHYYYQNTTASTTRHYYSEDAKFRESTTRYTTRYRYTTRHYTTRDDPYDTGSYIDADDFAAENWEEFDDYDEAYDYYEDYAEGYD